MKQIVSTVLACILVVSLAGCGIAKKAEEKAAEAIMEKFLEQGGAQDVDLDGETMTIKGPDGQEVILGSGEWPDSALGKSIPKFEKGSIESRVETEKSLMLTIYEVEKEDAKAYIEQNKPNFTLDNVEMDSDGMLSWGGSNDAGFRLMLTHSDDCFSITLIREE